jgi:formamidopyrimidine-DNA glycosylase
MPELPDIELYLHALRPRLVGARLDRLVLRSPFLLRTVEPSPDAFAGGTIRSVSRIGKRIIFEVTEDLFLVLHLMIAGRLKWAPRGKKPLARSALAALECSTGTLSLTEAGTKRRASIHLVKGRQGLAAFDRGGLDLFAATVETFATRLRSENHTLKRALTDPRMLDGVGNAYSDEILHAARLSPLVLTSRLTDVEYVRLFDACRRTMAGWRARLITEVGEGWPEKVTAFRPGMAVHGRYREPCLVCGSPVQRIVYAENETNYCPVCQTGGRLLADRALSRLLREDWPRSLDELEEMWSARQ